MLPSLLISLREVIEATLIVATVIGILTKLKQTNLIKTVWLATVAAVVTSIGLIAVGSFFGFKMQELYTGEIEELIEGILMIVSAMFVTWAVFFLHNSFGKYKTELLSKINTTVNAGQKEAIFVLVFTSVVREGIEIALFLSTLYFSTNPTEIFTGFILGTTIALIICYSIFKATIKLPIYYAFRVTSILLVLFAAGLLARGVHEMIEVGVIPELTSITFGFLPEKTSFVGATIKSIFGITKKMDILQLSLYATYTAFMTWWLKKNSYQTK